MKLNAWALLLFSTLLAAGPWLGLAPASPPLDKNLPASIETATFAVG